MGPPSPKNFSVEIPSQLLDAKASTSPVIFTETSSSIWKNSTKEQTPTQKMVPSTLDPRVKCSNELFEVCYHGEPDADKKLIKDSHAMMDVLHHSVLKRNLKYQLLLNQFDLNQAVKLRL